METESSHDKRLEVFALVSMMVLLSANAFLNASFGFVLPVFLAAIIPSALLSFFYPRAGLFSSVALTVFFERFHTLVPIVVADVEYKLYALDVVLAAALFSVLLRWVGERRLFRIRRPEGLLLLFFGIVTAIFLAGTLWSPESSFSTAFSTWKQYVFYGSVFFLVRFSIRTKEDFVLFSRVFLISVAAAGLFLGIGIVRGEGLWTEYTPLSTSGTRLLAFPHAFSFALAFLSLLFSAPFWLSDAGKKRVAIFSLFVLSVGVLGSLMRHLWLGIAGAVSFGMLFFPKMYRQTLLNMAIPVLSIVSFGILFFLSGLALFPQSDLRGDVSGIVNVFSERVFSIGNRYDESLAWRGEVWKGAISRFSESPLFGVGFGARVPVELGGYESFVEVRNMHNSWLAMLIQTGIIGTTVFLGFLALLFRRLFRTDFLDPFLSAAKYVILGLIVFQCLVFFSQPYLETNLLGLFFWVTLGLAWSLIGIGSRQNNPS